MAAAPAQNAAREATFAALYAAHAGRVERLARRLVGDDGDAADVTQDVFLRAYLGLGRLREREGAGGWLLAIARNAALDGLRARGRRRRRLASGLTEAPALAVPDRAAEGDPERAALAGETRALVWEIVGGLSGRHLTTLTLQLGGHDATAIAARLGVTRGHAHVLVCRARKEFGRAARAYALLALNLDRCGALRATACRGGPATFTPPRRREVERHADRCPVCAAVRRSLDADDAALAALRSLAPLGRGALPGS